MNTPLCLVLEDVHKSFDKREVLKGIDLSVAEHEVDPAQDMELGERLVDVLEDEAQRSVHGAIPAARRRRRLRSLSQSVSRASGIVKATKISAAAT